MTSSHRQCVSGPAQCIMSDLVIRNGLTRLTFDISFTHTDKNSFVRGEYSLFKICVPHVMFFSD